MAKFGEIYKNRGIMDALMGISEDDAPEVDASQITSIDQLQNALRPSNDQKKQAFWQGLYDMGTALQNRQGLGAGLMAMGNKMQEGRQANPEVLQKFQTQMALKKLFDKPAKKRVEAFGTGKDGKPIKFQEDVDETTGERFKVEGSEIPYWQPKSDELTPWQQAQLDRQSERDALYAQNMNSLIGARDQKTNPEEDDNTDLNAPWRNVAGQERERMKGRTFASGQKFLDSIAEARAKAANLANESQSFMSAYNKQDPSVGWQKMLPDSVAGLDSELATMDAITARLAPNMRAEGSGATSDFESKGFLRGTVARDKPKQTNQDIADAYKALSEREAERYQFFDQYLTEKGHLQGAESEWKKYMDAEPLFTPEYGYNKARKPYAVWASGQTAPRVSEEDIQETMRANNMTREQVLAKIRGQ